MKNKYLRGLQRIVNRLIYGRNDAFYIDLFVNGEMNSPTALRSEKRRWDVIQAFIEQFAIPVHGSRLSILEVGCGRGWMCNLLIAYGDVLGCDPVSKVIEYARTLYPQVTFEVGSYNIMLDRHGAGSRDLIVSSEVLEHIPLSERSAFASSLHAMLKPNGFCIISTPRAEVESSTGRAFDQPIENWMTEGEVEALFTGSGFTTTSMQRIEIAKTDLYQVWIFQKAATA
jgi:2-polyprenyl-3-methyl-5-hydroxy-6-metoxy-1,4-benzoquinol methylase